jgi:hypothetical protein
VSACEKCWRDASKAMLTRGVDQVEEYHRLLQERKDNPCSPEEQDGSIYEREGGES